MQSRRKAWEGAGGRCRKNDTCSHIIVCAAGCYVVNAAIQLATDIMWSWAFSQHDNGMNSRGNNYSAVEFWLLVRVRLVNLDD